MNSEVKKQKKYCIESICFKRANFNFIGEKKGLYCSEHRIDGMIDVKHKICIHEGCNIQPFFNVKGEKKGLYCKEHKLEGMINVISPQCFEEGCLKQPVFNIEGEKKGLYCVTHKKDGMVNVITPLCSYEGCDVLPVFNFEGQKRALYCSEHKEDGMINIKSDNCVHPGCTTQPSYNFEGKKRLYCKIHKKDGMVDVKHPLCKSEWCYMRVSEKFKGYCFYCFIHMFPDEKICRNYKTKEKSVVDYVKDNFSHIDLVFDKRISDGCSRRRPDILIDLGYQIIIVEVDENQHINYGTSCENKRMMELSLDLGERPIIFIRFNPDDYIKNSEKVSSCWGINGKGICCVKKTKKTEWEERLQTLNTEINYWLNPEHKLEKTIKIIHLFYDDNEE